VLHDAAIGNSIDLTHVSGQPDGTKAASLHIADSPRGIGRQILDSMQASLTQGQREVVVRLQPPELGNVVVRFREQDGQLHGLLEVNGSDAKREIERVLPQVLQSLHDQGTQVRRVDVTLSDQMQGDSGRGQLQQDAWSRQNWGQGREQFDGSPTRWSGPDRDSPAQETPDADQPPEISSDRIDMLL
jgi:flagellar hook-length control protein FliK